MRCSVAEEEGCGTGRGQGDVRDCDGIGASSVLCVSMSVIRVKVTPHSLA